MIDNKVITFRKLLLVDLNNFGSDVLNSSLPSLFAAPLSGLDNLIIQYNDVLSSILDIHAPLRTKTVTLRPAAAW